MNTRVDINNIYPPENEIRTDSRPYDEYYKILLNTFDFTQIKSFCDVGCATGHLIYNLKNNNNIIVKGYEYFEYHKTSPYCHREIRDDIEIYDIRDPFPSNINKYDIVNCTEVGEHIDPAFADILIENCKKISNKYIIFTWSSHGGVNDPNNDPLHQHLNPLNNQEYITLMHKHGLVENIKLTELFLRKSLEYHHFYYWWRESFVIWEIK
jgi:hypothetical protein